jgi:hypothetical protein
VNDWHNIGRSVLSNDVIAGFKAGYPAPLAELRRQEYRLDALG